MAFDGTGVNQQQGSLLFEYQLDFAKAALKMALSDSEEKLAEGVAEATATILQAYGKPINDDLLALVLILGQETAALARTYGLAEAATSPIQNGD
jgi:hypothetical protein